MFKELLSIFISIFAIIISIMSYVTTRQALKQYKRENNNTINSLKTEAMMNITQSHRSLFLDIIKDDKLVSFISDKPNIDDYRKEMVGSVLINHCNFIFMYASKSFIEDDDWKGLQNDILDFFNWPIVKNRWPEIRKFYSLEFQDFIDSLTVKGRINVSSNKGLK